MNDDKNIKPHANTMISLKDFALREGVSHSLVYRWFKDGRLPGAMLVGRDVILPINTSQPEKKKPGRPKTKPTINSDD